MTHLYVILVGGTVVRSGDTADATALAWAGDTVLAVGTDAEVLAISRGDSTVIDLAGATLIPLHHHGEPRWPTDGRLELGGPASFAIVSSDPRRNSTSERVQASVVVRSGVVVHGALPGVLSDGSGHHSPEG